jgi:transcriptional regulator with PAS, ATPase and Fis domain
VRVRREIAQAARAKTTVLITGETGTGKELVAEAIHEKSKGEGEFIRINCPGQTATLMQAQLFGYRRGSFTGAGHGNRGSVGAAAGGSVLFDEIGDASADFQVALLRFLETGEVHGVGQTRPDRISVRVMASTNRNLPNLVKSNIFRQDLFYRINVFTIDLPPLRERSEDVPLLVQFYLKRFNAEFGNTITLDPGVMRYLVRWPWPGNIRELVHLISRLVAKADSGQVITPEDLPHELLDGRGEGQLTAAVGSEPGMAEAELFRRSDCLKAQILIKRMVDEGGSFWSVVHRPYLDREISRHEALELVRQGLTAARGYYKQLARDWNVEPGHYKNFNMFLRKHRLLLPFREFRAIKLPRGSD